MGKLVTCISMEWKKFFKSRLPLISAVAFLLVPFMGGFFMYILKDPELAESLGFISTKAQIMGTADWTSYLELLSQAVSVGGLIVFGFITSWMFGREYSDRTIKDLLSLPVSRTIIIVSKFSVVFIWSLFVSILVLILGLLTGKMVGLGSVSQEIITQGAAAFIICSLLTILLSTPVAFFASAGRGYLTPLGFIILTVVLSQVVSAVGYGEFFPWSIPALAAGITGESGINLMSIIVVSVVGLTGLAATAFWWRFSDLA